MFSLSVLAWIYVLSISLQLSGAVLLLIRYSFRSIEKGVLDNNKKENRVEGETLILGNTQPTPSEYVENVWLNRIAFTLIAFGYLLGVFGENIGSKIILFLLILFLSLVITMTFVLFAKRKAMKQGN